MKINIGLAGFPARRRRRRATRQVRFRFFDLWIKFGKIISKACPVGNLFSFGVCEGFNSGAKEYEANFQFSEKVGFSFFESDCSAPPRKRGAGLSCSPKSTGFWRANREILMLSGE
ncbi:hypothetical protein KKE58_00425 [Patescibacteria group bacterium]|nr:hypothetical protein [Patescibacteria group bacterium]